jgi:hypothetical protein
MRLSSKYIRDKGVVIDTASTSFVSALWKRKTLYQVKRYEGGSLRTIPSVPSPSRLLLQLRLIAVDLDTLQSCLGLFPLLSLLDCFSFFFASLTASLYEQLAAEALAEG